MDSLNIRLCVGLRLGITRNNMSKATITIKDIKDPKTGKDVINIVVDFDPTLGSSESEKSQSHWIAAKALEYMVGLQEDKK